MTTWCDDPMSPEDQGPDPSRQAAATLEELREELLDLEHDGPNVATKAFAREARLRLDRIIEDMR